MSKVKKIINAPELIVGQTRDGVVATANGAISVAIIFEALAATP